MNRVITEKGVAKYRLVTSQFADEAYFYAASVIKDYLYRATGAVVPYFSDRCEKRENEIRIGDARGHSEDTSMLHGDGFRIYTDGDDIVICAKTHCGAVYGAYKFLELTIGLRTFTRDVETYDKKEVLSIEDMDLYENPDFEYRDSYFRLGFDCDYAVKNRLNSSLALIPREKGGRLKFYNFHHSFYDILPPALYYDEHPEYFSEVEGVRLREGGQLCLTNEGAIAESIKRVKEWIKARPDCKVFSVAQNDWYNYCTCPKCREMDEREGSPAGSNIYFVNRIAEEIEKEYPDVLIHTFAYQYTRRAPKYIKPRDNVIVRLCNIECTWDEPLELQAKLHPESANADFLQNIISWGKICRHLYLWDYCCNFHFYLMPFPNYHVLGENMRLYKRSNIAGMLQEGNFSYGNAAGLADMQTYLTAKLMWKADTDVDTVIREFTDAVYGNAAPLMREYIEVMENAVKGHGMTLFYPLNSDFITDELITRVDDILNRAMIAETGEVRRRIEREYLGIRFLKIARMPLGTQDRDALADELYEDVKAHGISEVQERIKLENSFYNLKISQYCTSREDSDRMYYIMR